MCFLNPISFPTDRKATNATRNVAIYMGVETTSRESDRNLTAPVCADSFLTSRGSRVLEAIAFMVGGSTIAVAEPSLPF